MRRVTGLVAVWLLLAAAGAAAAAASGAAEPLAVVRVPARAAVLGPDILLGDIAQIETADEELAGRLAALSLGRAAIPGQVRELNMATVRVRMRQQSLPEKHIVIEAEKPSVAVATRALEVPGPALAEAARTAVLEQALPAGAAADPVWRAAELSLTCVDPGPAVVADGALALHVSRVSGTPPGSMTAAVDIVVDGAVRRTVMVRCDALVALDVPVVTAPVARHDALTEDNVAVERREFASLPRGLLLPEAVLAGPGAGLRATRPLTPGTVLTDSMVEAAPVVLRGAPVTIVAATARIHVAAPGVALEDGRVGDVIRVQNSLSGQVIRARVAAADRVEAIVP